MKDFENPRLPTRNIFFIVGGQRCGTTYLYEILNQHPEVCMQKPLSPEPKFFSLQAEWQKGLDYYEQKYFSHCKGEKVWGEKSTSYYEQEYVAERIKKNYPKSKIIFILRNPVYRALSNYFFTKNNGLERRTLKEVFIDEIPPPTIEKIVSVSPFKYLERGIYKKFIQNFLKHFHRDKIKIIIFEKTINSSKMIANCYRFLGVSPDFTPHNINKKINISGLQDKTINQKILEKLTKYYTPHVEDLENYLNLDLSYWKLEMVDPKKVF